MLKRPYVIGCCLGFCAVVFLLIGILTPILLTNMLDEKIKDVITLTKSNKRKLWGEAPGDFKVKIYQDFAFSNILNPQGLLQGEQPQIEYKKGYVFQEYDKFLSPHWEKKNGHKLVRFHLLRWTKKTHNTVWPKGVTLEDPITQFSVGSLGAWYQLKHMSRQQLALSSLFQIVNGLETSLMVTAYSQAVLLLLGGYKGAQTLIFKPAGIGEKEGRAIWDDEFYGLGSGSTIGVWIQAMMENLENDEFVITHPISGTLSIIWSYFGLSDEEMISIFSGHFKDAYDLTALLFFNNYECPENENEFSCDPVYLANLQWTFSGLTLYPPFMAGSVISVAKLNDTFNGFPEMFYFYNATTTGNKYGEYEFTMDDYTSLFYYNRSNNFPAYSEFTLLDVGKMNSFFALAYEGNFTGIQGMLNLSSEVKARVLWDYVNALLDFTALQGRYDPTVYGIGNRGMTQELSLGVAGSQTLYSLLVSMSITLPIAVSTVYNFIQLNNQGVECQTLISQVLSQQNSSICSLYELEWSLSSTGLTLWILAYWNDINSTSWTQFQSISQLTQSEMLTLFKTSNNFTSIFAQLDLDIKQNYNCTNTGPRCDPMYLARMQWGSGLVTMNLPSVFQQLSIKNSSTITNFHFLSMNLTGTPEYFGFTTSQNTFSPLTPSQINSLLSYSGILNPIVLQEFFLFEYERNYSGQIQLLNVSNTEPLIDYLRYMIDLYFLGGIIQTKTVNQILYADYNEPLLIQTKNMSPLLGGNPSINLNATSLAQNMTQDRFQNVSDDMKDGMDTGEDDYRHVRRYKLYQGKPYINIIQPAYLGEGINGSIIQNVNFNPWNGEIPMSGTDAWAFTPFNHKDSNYSVFVDVPLVIMHGKYNKDVMTHGFECRKLIFNPKDFENSTQNPVNVHYDMNGPKGLINQTGLLQAPLFLTKPFFLGADPTLIKMINYSDPSVVQPEKYDSYYQVQKLVGANFRGELQLQFVIELKPDMLYPKLGEYNLKNFGYNTYMPFVSVNRNTKLSQYIVDKFFGVIHVIETVILVAQIIGYSVAGILIILLGVFVWKKNKQRRMVKDTQLGQSLQIR